MHSQYTDSYNYSKFSRKIFSTNKTFVYLLFLDQFKLRDPHEIL